MLHSLLLARSPYGPKFVNKDTAADIYDVGDHFLILLEAAGFDKDDFSLQVRNNSITIDAEKDIAAPEGYTLKNRSANRTVKINRRFGFRDSINLDEISATMSNGLLRVTLPKKAARTIPVTVQ